MSELSWKEWGQVSDTLGLFAHRNAARDVFSGHPLSRLADVRALRFASDDFTHLKAVHVRNGSLADIRKPIWDVRLLLKSGRAERQQSNVC